MNISDPYCYIAMKEEQQGEGVAFAADGKGFFSTSEGNSRPIYFYIFSDPSVASVGFVGISGLLVLGSILVSSFLILG